jgi:hypothetical protein
MWCCQLGDKIGTGTGAAPDIYLPKTLPPGAATI